MTIEELIAGLREAINLHDLLPDEQGVYTIVFDEGLQIELLGLSDRQLLIRSHLADVPEDQSQQETFYREALQHNLLGLRQQHCTLSLDIQQKSLWLHRTVNTQRLDVHEFCEQVEDFVNTREWWRQFDTSTQSSLPPMMNMPINMLRP